MAINQGWYLVDREVGEVFPPLASVSQESKEGCVVVVSADVLSHALHCPAL